MRTQLWGASCGGAGAAGAALRLAALELAVVPVVGRILDLKVVPALAEVTINRAQIRFGNPNWQTNFTVYPGIQSNSNPICIEKDYYKFSMYIIK